MRTDLILAVAANHVSVGEQFAFWILGSIAVIGALGMVLSKNTVHAALWLVLVMFCLAVFYVVQDAPFLGAVQIIVYAGAIMVLFLFVVMLLNAPHEDTEFDERTHPLLRPGPMKFGALLAMAFTIELIWALTTAGGESGRFPGAAVSSVADLGRILFTDYAFAFEVTSILILVAMVGAVLMARREERPGKRSEGRS